MLVLVTLFASVCIIYNVCVRVCMCVCVYIYMWVCVYERERERDRDMLCVCLCYDKDYCQCLSKSHKLETVPQLWCSGLDWDGRLCSRCHWWRWCRGELWNKTQLIIFLSCSVFCFTTARFLMTPGWTVTLLANGGDVCCACETEREGAGR